MNTPIRRASILPVILTASLAPFACSPPHGAKPSDAAPQSSASGPTPSPNPLPASSLDWKFLEAPLLNGHIQLTTRDRFIKAGEAYFDHASPPRWIIFQAVPVPPPGEEADPFYSMYVARLRYDRSGISGIDSPVKISPDASANTCGWFDPVNKAHVIFGSTLVKPGSTQRPGFQVGTRSYVWMFPHEMEVVSRTVPEIARDGDPNAPLPAMTGDAIAAKPVFTLPNYDAECSFSKDGKFILYAHVRNEPTRGKDDADIWIYNTQTGEHRELVHGDGYDGGPFFSPDNKRICYRSDRKGDDLLQLFIADLKFDAAGNPIGIEREHQVTDNGHVNWAPYWHPSGQFLIYGTSEVGHDNYEVFATEVPPAGVVVPPAGESSSPPVQATSTLRHRRITYATGADVLPVFSDDGKYMMWTAQRGPKVEGETKPSSQVWVAKFNPLAAQEIATFPAFPPGALTEATAKQRMIDLLKVEEARTKARVQAAGGKCADYDLRGLRLTHITQGWRGSVNVWNVPDGDEYVFALNDGRVFSASGHAVPRDAEVRELMFAPEITAKP